MNHFAQLTALQSYFKTQPVLKAYLFGSQARNEADKRSDIDILVELDHSKPVGLKFIQMQLDLEALLKAKVDLVSSNGLSPYLREAIERQKLLIYER